MPILISKLHLLRPVHFYFSVLPLFIYFLCMYRHVCHNVHVRGQLIGVNLLLPSRAETQVTGFNGKHLYPLRLVYYPKGIYVRRGFE